MRFKKYILFLLMFSFSAAQTIMGQTDILHLHKKKLWQNAGRLNKVNQTNSATANYDAIYYKLELEISFSPNLLTGKVTGHFRNKINELKTLVLDFDDALTISAISGPVKSYTHSGQKITIELTRTFLKDELIELTIEYSGVPDAGSNRWFVFDRLPNGADHVWTLSEPFGAKQWWPCKDSPADKADSVDIVVTVPDNQIVASNGTLISDSFSGDGKRTFHWHEKYPIATYLVSLAIAPYTHFTDQYTLPDNKTMLLDYYVYPSDAQTAISIFPDVKDYLDALSFYFGPYPFADEKYGMAQFGWSGGMEHQTISSIGRVSPDWVYLYVHELGHQWFGDALTCASWSDIWLNDGFASYSEALYAEWAGFNGYPPGNVAYHAYMQTQAYFTDGTINISDTTDADKIFDRIVYDKGSWVLHMLRRVLGDADFFNVLKTYSSQLQFKSVSTGDFKIICEEISGKALDTFFDQWLYYPFFPQYMYSWEETESESIRPRIALKIIQEQAAPIYEMPIDIQITFPSGQDSLVQVFNFQKEQTYIFDLPQTPVNVKLDPNKWILKNARDESAGAYTSAVKIKKVYPNPATKDVTIIVRYWEQGNLDLRVYDNLGREVSKLTPYYVSSIHDYYYKWDRKNNSGNLVSSGIYFLRPYLSSGKKTDIRKIIILK